MWYLRVTLFSALAIMAAGPACGDGPKLFTWGRDPARGALVNVSAGAVAGSPIDPNRPTVVVVHGLNPFAPLLRCNIAECYADAIGARYGPGVNVLSWDWNSATMPSLRPRVNDEQAVAQGYALGRTLLRLGIDPANLHLIGQSSGAVVVAAAARVLVNATGRPVGRLTLLDPVGSQHPLIFGRLGAITAAASIEHYWAPGPSGFGREVHYPGVHSQAVPTPSRLFGLVRPFHADHFNTVRWHLQRITP